MLDNQIKIQVNSPIVAPMTTTTKTVNEKFILDTEDSQKNENVMFPNSIDSKMQLASKFNFLSFLTRKFKLKRSISETCLHIDTKSKTTSQTLEGFSKSNTILNEY